MNEDLYFNITPRSADVKYVLFGREEDGFRIYAHDTNDEPIWRYDQIQDCLDHILPKLAELIDENSKWAETDTGKPVTMWSALVRLSAASFGYGPPAPRYPFR